VPSVKCPFPVVWALTEGQVTERGHFTVGKPQVMRHTCPGVNDLPLV